MIDAIADYLTSKNYLTDTQIQAYLSQLKEIDLNALSIRFNDNERGNYFLYNRAGNITAEENKKLRLLTAVFDPFENNIYAKSVLMAPVDSIKWSFPASNTMIQPVKNCNVEDPEICSTANLDLSQSGSTVFIDTIASNNSTGSYEIEYNKDADTFDFYAPIDSRTSIPNKNPIFLSQVGFYIKKTLNHAAGRNNVFLTVQKGGQTYTAQVQMHFGSMGTSGSDYT